MTPCAAAQRAALALVLLVPLRASALDVSDLERAPESDGWVLVRDQEGVKVWTRELEGSSIHGLRSDGIVDAPLARVAQVFFDHQRAPEWIDRMADEHVVRFEGDDAYIEYNRIKLPFPLSDRDYVTRVHLAVDPARQVVALTSSSIDAADLPSPCVRGTLQTAYLLSAVEGGARTRIQVLYLMDPNGFVPHWVVNLFQKSWPIATFRGIRRQLLRSDLREPPLPRFREVLRLLRGG